MRVYSPKDRQHMLSPRGRIAITVCTRREFYGKNFQIRILNWEQVEKLTSMTKRI